MSTAHAPSPTQEFHSATRAAQIWLAAGAPDHAERCLRIALRHANRISPAARNMTLRVLCWVRQEAALQR